jgi:hypothetical protein
VQRDSAKHGPRLDEELQKEVEPLLRGAPIEARVEESREKEGPGDYDRDPDARTAPAGNLGADAVEARRELSRHLRPSAFPAQRDELVAEAAENNAPLPVLEALRALPEGVTFATAHEVWVAFSDPELAREGRDVLRRAAATEPLNDASG